MRRIGLVALAGALLAGCSDTSPASRRLSPGEDCILAHPANRTVGVHIPEEADSVGIGVRMVPVGTRVQVESDEGKPNVGPIAYNRPDFRPDSFGYTKEQGDHREVKITVMEGEHIGLVGAVDRFSLRPVAK